MTEFPLQGRIMRASAITGGTLCKSQQIVIRRLSALVFEPDAQSIYVSGGPCSE